jgi:hypothetical protein
MNRVKRARPRFMTGLAIFCAATLVFLVYRDLFIPEIRDVEVWFGFEIRGAAALLTAPIHWAIFAMGAWAAWNNRAWILPSAAGYAFYIALSHWVWNIQSPAGEGWEAGLLQAAVFSLPGVALLLAHFRRRADSA